MEAVTLVVGHAKEAGTKVIDAVAGVVGRTFDIVRGSGVRFDQYINRPYEPQNIIPGIIHDLKDVTFLAVPAVALAGVTDVWCQMSSNFICRRRCHHCKGWDALQCTMCRGTGKVKYRGLKSGRNYWENSSKDDLAVSIANGQEEIIHYPASLDTEFIFSPKELPTKVCPTCEGSGVMECPECRGKLKLNVSIDKFSEDPSLSWNLVRKNQHPSEHVLASMEDPALAAFWLIAKPEVEGGYKFDEDIKQKLWWKYKEEFLRYAMVRKSVAKREPGWDYMQKILYAIDPTRASEDPVVVKDVPYYRARKKIEAEVMKLEVPQRPHNWGVSTISLEGTVGTKDDLEDPRQKQVSEDIVNRLWVAKWRKQKCDELITEKVQKGIARFQQEAELQERKRRRRNRKWWKWF